MAKRPNLILFGIDSLRCDHMSCYGYHRLTTPHIDNFARDSVLFLNNLSPHIPTTPAYGSMLTGMDCFSTEIVALRHRGPLTDKVRTLAEILRDEGYASTCVGFTGNPSARGFDNYLNYAGWGSWDEGPSPKAMNLNAQALPELERLAAGDQPFFLFLRHMDPHAPYLPVPPFDKAFYAGDAADPNLPDTMGPVRDFKPFCDFHLSWMPPGIRDIDYVTAAYDGAVAYMDACIAQIFQRIDELGLRENTIVALNGDHGETLDEHDCYFDHHGLYEPTLTVPLIIRAPGQVPEGAVIPGMVLHQDLVPTLLELLDVDPGIDFDGQTLSDMWCGEKSANYSECYLTEATWMRKHGWRTTEWKLIRALEPDFHYKPPVELYNLHTDPLELHNVAESEPAVVDWLTARMEAHIARREAEKGITAPIYTNTSWHGVKEGPFESSDEAYHGMHIGSASQAKKLQAGEKK
ncbi:MAG: sulfatase [Fimbriimonadaceae bacterium]|nr:sulfatase [Fimbriimonadaceae bacterium]